MQFYPIRMVSHEKPNDPTSGPSPLATPSAVKGKSVSCGESHTLVVDIIGKLYSCGNNDYGQLGTGSKENDCSLVPVVMGEKIAQAAAGNKYSLVLTESGRIYGTGNNYKGALGTGNSNANEVLFKPCA